MSAPPVFVGPLLHLRTLPQFAGLARHQLAPVAHEAEEVLIQRGAPLLEAGEAADAMYMIVDGWVAVGGNGTRVGPGGVVGFLESLIESGAPVAARAETDVVALRLETDALRGLCEQSFAVLDALLEHVARRTTESLSALVESISGRPEAWPEGEELRLDRVGRILALHRAPIFPSTGMDGLAELAGEMREVHLDTGEPLWGEGAVPDGFYLVCRGSVTLSGGPTGRRVLGQGGVPGLVSGLAQKPTREVPRAIEPTVLLYASVDTLLDVLEDHFEMAFGFLGRLAANVLTAEARAAQRPAP